MNKFIILLRPSPYMLKNLFRTIYYNLNPVDPVKKRFYFMFLSAVSVADF
jgi:hypothetical protein